MQFGRFHGIALASLGFLLILVQIAIGFTSTQPDKPNEASTRVVEHKTTIFPGVIGGGLLVVGLFFFFAAQRGDEPPAEKSVK